MGLETDNFSESVKLEIEQLLNLWKNDAAPLLQVLIGIQQHYNHIPSQAIPLVAAKLQKTSAEVNGVVDFYGFLNREYLGKYDVRFSNNIIERMKGNTALATRLSEKLGITLGAPNHSQPASVGFTSCIGMSDQGPSMLVNGQTIPRLDTARIDTIANLILNRIPLNNWPKNLFQIDAGVHLEGPLLSHSLKPGEGIEKALARGPVNTLQNIKKAGLRGRGGAGFTTADKWYFCQQAEGDYRTVVCNADEGEPGTFKDRLLLQQYAEQMIEGMTICAATIGASKGFIYLRGEYLFLHESLLETLDIRRQNGLLGETILGHEGFNFDIAIHLGAGAYICGEESALIESLEGKRGIPRARPPFPVTHGYMDKPTVVNNVETFVAATAITLSGADWYRKQGTERATGTKLLSISGDCDQPGIYEFPFGTPLSQVLDVCGAENTQAVQVGGAAGQLVPASEFDRCIDFSDLPTGGSFMIFNKRRSILDIIKNFTAFFAHESCGFCTPCRIGSTLLNERLRKVIVGHATNEDLVVMQSIGELMTEASHCGLGQTAANPALDAMKHFPDSFAINLKSTRFEPAFDLDKALGSAREMANRSDPDAYLKGGGV